MVDWFCFHEVDCALAFEFWVVETHRQELAVGVARSSKQTHFSTNISFPQDTNKSAVACNSPGWNSKLVVEVRDDVGDSSHRRNT